MRLINVIHDQFKEHYYRIHVFGEPSLLTDIEPIEFYSPKITESFVGWLDVYPGYWRSLLYDCPFDGHDFRNRPFSDTEEGRVSRLLVQGIMELYPIEHLDGHDDDKPPVQFPTLPTANGTHYTLAPAAWYWSKRIPSLRHSATNSRPCVF